MEAIDAESGEMASLYDPRRDRWSDHFTWSEDTMLLLGLTSTGRATIEKLQLNRIGVVNLRFLLYLIGHHPPAETSEQS